MRYIIWKLNWDGVYGKGPESYAFIQGIDLSPSGFIDSSSGDYLVLGFLRDDTDIDELAEWEAYEVTQDDALAFAVDIDSTAAVRDSGEICGWYDPATISS